MMSFEHRNIVQALHYITFRRVRKRGRLGGCGAVAAHRVVDALRRQNALVGHGVAAVAGHVTHEHTCKAWLRCAALASRPQAHRERGRHWQQRRQAQQRRRAPAAAAGRVSGSGGQRRWLHRRLAAEQGGARGAAHHAAAAARAGAAAGATAAAAAGQAPRLQPHTPGCGWRRRRRQLQQLQRRRSLCTALWRAGGRPVPADAAQLCSARSWRQCGSMWPWRQQRLRAAMRRGGCRQWHVCCGGAHASRGGGATPAGCREQRQQQRRAQRRRLTSTALER
jgi:hypothetical protein